ncbi:lysosome membrane protein 2-like isoform X2 [Sycon ciliatum]|uniref:lysosome membrane protein 2-like isoform X2 n=1 Tax=Sycon ciliatum TaxID=27933 RepID=UPI0031F6038F
MIHPCHGPSFHGVSLTSDSEHGPSFSCDHWKSPVASPDTLEVCEGCTSYSTWLAPTEPVYMSFFVFNVTNPDDVLDGDRPNVETFGPFTYQELRPRKNVTFMKNGTVKWIQPKTYIPLNTSFADPNTFEVCTINFPIMFLGSMLDPLLAKLAILPKKVQKLVLELPKILAALSGEDTIICRTVNEILWGLYDPVFERIRWACLNEGQALYNTAHDILDNVLRNAILFIANGLLSVGNLIPEGGIISLQVNGSDDGTWATYTGETDMQLINTLDLYNNSRYVPWWKTDTCNMVNGTDGTQFHPHVKKTDMLFSFVTDMCRSIYLIYNGTVELKGIELSRFTPPPALFDNGTVFEYLKGFCNPRCWPSGTQDISLCKGGLPIMASSPHFLYADPVYLENVTGMNPNFQDHATIVDIEPMTGLMLRGNKRLQINVRVSNISFLPGGYALRECFLPLFYANESAVVSDAHAAKLRNTLKPLSIIKILQWCFLAVGIVVFTPTVIYNVRRYRRENEAIDVPEGQCTENVPLLN